MKMDFATVVCENDECEITWLEMNDEMQKLLLDENVNRFRHARQKKSSPYKR